MKAVLAIIAVATVASFAMHWTGVEPIRWLP